MSPDLYFCKHYNIVYKITCLTCNIIYIGQTANPLNLRINLHRSKVKNDNPNNTTYEIKHFKKHGFTNIDIQIMEIVSEEKDRLLKEDLYILKHRSLYPYGLNTNLNFYKSDINCIYNLFYEFAFNKFERNNNPRSKRGSRINSGNINNIIPEYFIDNLEKSFITDCNVKFVKTEIFKLKIKKIKKLKDTLQDFQFTDTHAKNLITDLIKFRLDKFDKQDSIIYFISNFQQNSFNSLNINNIFKTHKQLFPIKGISIINSFKYNKSFSKLLFNYSEVAKNYNQYLSIK